MNLLAAIAALFAILALFFLTRTVSFTRRGRFLRAGGAGIGSIGSAAIAAAAVLLGLTYLSYDRLTAEQAIASIAFRQLAPEAYQARLMVDGRLDRLYELHGNEWQLDARLVTWKPPVTVLGLDPVYRLERLSGRYADIQRERREERTVYDLSEDTAAFDVWTWARRYPALTPGIDAYYGSATYVPMADGARFDVSLSRDALVARPANEQARAAVGTWGDESL